MKIAIVGAGIFGCEIALSLSVAGHSIHLYESNSNILSGASKVNQARIHTGMHYPRDYKTAKESFDAHDKFIRKYSRPITFSLDQYYAVASEGSKVTPDEFLEHADNIGITYEECDPLKFFRPGRVDCVIKVPESTLDYLQLKSHYLDQFDQLKNFELIRNVRVHKVVDVETGVLLDLGTTETKYDYVIVATYSTLFELLKDHISEIANDQYFQYQGCEVALGRVSKLLNTGITVMDGDFWSTMPFGGSGLHSLTSVAQTPHISVDSHDSELAIKTSELSTRQEIFAESFEFFMKDEYKFEYVRSFYTVKTLAKNSQTTAARPTEIFLNPNGRIIGVFSGKIASALDAAAKVRDFVP